MMERWNGFRISGLSLSEKLQPLRLLWLFLSCRLFIFISKKSKSSLVQKSHHRRDNTLSFRPRINSDNHRANLDLFTKRIKHRLTRSLRHDVLNPLDFQTKIQIHHQTLSLLLFQRVKSSLVMLLLLLHLVTETLPCGHNLRRRQFMEPLYYHAGHEECRWSIIFG